MRRLCTAKLLAVWLAVLNVHVICETLSDSNSGGSVRLSTGAQLADALANPRVTIAVLNSDILLQHADFAGHHLPIVIRRNLTVEGDTPFRQLDFNYVYNKVRLEAGVVLTFRGLYSLNARAKSVTFTPGLDLLVSTRPGNTALVRFMDGFHDSGLCYSAANSQGNIADFVIRPALLPGGPQRVLVNLPQLGCKNSSAARGWERCWSSRMLMIDLGLACFDLDLDDNVVEATETLGMAAFERAKRPVNYVLWFLNQTMLCHRMESEECTRQLGIVGCAWQAARSLPAMKPNPESELDSAPPEPVLVRGRKSLVLPLALGITGGVVVLGGLFGLLLWSTRKKRWCAYWKRPTTLDQEGAALGCRRSCTCGGSSDEAATITAITVINANEPKRRESSSTFRVGIELATEDSGLTTGCAKVPSTEALETKQQDSQRRREYLCNESCAVTLLSPHRPDLNLNIRLNTDCDNVPAVGATPAAAEPRRQQPTAGSTSMLPGSSSHGFDGSSDADFPVRSNGNNVDGAAVGGRSEDRELRLLGVVLGRGASSKVVVGEYQGQRVAVKLMEFGGLGVAELKSLYCKHTGQQKEDRDGHDQQQQRPQGGPHPRTEKEEIDVLLKAFRQEIEVLGRCQHPNVVRLMAACTAPPRLCLVMELAETNLARMVHCRRSGGTGPKTDDGLLPLEKVLHIATDIARGLEYLHPTILHRDVKPANVLIFNGDGARPHAKLGDFGLSRLWSTVGFTQNPDAGTPPYMAPECFDLANVVTHHADIYSWAVIVYEMLSGKLPWPKATITEIAYNVTLRGNRPPLSSVSCDRCPRKLRKLVVQCWDQDPQRRPAAAEVVKQLLLIQEMTNHVASAHPEQTWASEAV